MINALSIDLEYWYNAESIKKYLPDPEKREDRIIEATMPILNILDKHNVRATFFVLGIVAVKYPELVSEIYEKGHEIATHGYSHKLLYDLGKEKFEDDVKRSVDLLESITGERAIGFRAPRFSINNSTKWAFEILKKYGFKYDSSIYPIRTKFYGVPNAPLQPYRPSVEDITKHDPNGDIIEFPLTVLKFVRNIPISGGFYLRILPFSALRFAIESVNKIRPAIVYIHPWETYSGIQGLKMPPFTRFVNRYGVKSALKKFEGLLAFFNFKPVREVLNGI